MSDELLLGLGVVAIFVGFAGGAALLLVPRDRPSQLTRRRVRTGGAAITSIKDQATSLAERSLDRTGRRRRLNEALEQAGIAMRAGELIVLVVSGCFVAFALGTVLTNPLVGLALATVVAFGSRVAVGMLADRRRARFAEQLEQTLPLMASSLRAGFGVMQAIDAVARESDAPTSEEFRRLVTEQRIGRDPSEAMAAMAERVGSEDFAWVVQAIEIHRQVGGDLSQVLDNVASTIRDRNRVRRQISALSGEGRLSAMILFLLPLGMLVVLAALNPGYIAELTTSTLGWMMLAVAGGLLVVGGLWLRRIVRLVY